MFSCGAAGKEALSRNRTEPVIAHSIGTTLVARPAEFNVAAESGAGELLAGCIADVIGVDAISVETITVSKAASSVGQH